MSEITTIHREEFELLKQQVEQILQYLDSSKEAIGLLETAGKIQPLHQISLHKTNLQETISTRAYYQSNGL